VFLVRPLLAEPVGMGSTASASSLRMAELVGTLSLSAD
jgi:hypothetical protein